MPLFKREHLKKLKITEPRNELGSGTFGKVFQGVARFEHPGTGKIIKQRVAIKKFFSPTLKFDPEKYRRVITDLEEAKVRLPKMDLHTLTEEEAKQFNATKNSNSRDFFNPGDPVVVSQLFVREGRSKLEGRTANIHHEDTRQVKEDFLKESIKMINAGYLPEFDVFEYMSNQGAIPIDLDLFVHNYDDPTVRNDLKSKDLKQIEGRMTFFRNCASDLIGKIEYMARNHEERAELYDLAISLVDEEWVKESLRIRKFRGDDRFNARVKYY